MPVKKLRTKKTNKFLDFFNPKTLRGGIALFMLVFVIAGAAFLIYRSFAGTGGAGDLHTCWVKESDKTLWCWGDNRYGQLGLGDTKDRLVPTKVNISNVAQVSAGQNHTCARKTDNTLWCWGWNSVGQLGLGKTTSSEILAILPEKVNIDNVAQVSAGYEFTCARKTDNTLWCWGRNDGGQLGLGNATISTCGSDPCAGNPRLVYIDNVAQVSAGYHHTCARKTDNTLWCWGWNYSGQLGLGNATISTCDSNPCAKSPKQVSIANVAEVSAGFQHTCARKTDNTLWCWGWNKRGQLGLGNTALPTCYYGEPCAKSPKQVNIGNVAQVSAGGLHTCARKTDGTMWCWGYNLDGQLGLGDKTNRLMPTKVNISNLSRVSTGFEHTCTAKTDGTLWCWGWNKFGQLGIGSIVNKLTPTLVPGFSWK